MVTGESTVIVDEDAAYGDVTYHWIADDSRGFLHPSQSSSRPDELIWREPGSGVGVVVARVREKEDPAMPTSCLASPQSGQLTKPRAS